jgi:hypothetical protein
MRIACIAGIVFAIAALSGCAVGRTADGGAVLGLRAGTHPDAGAVVAAGQAIGGIFGGPAGSIIGGTLATTLLGAFGVAAHNSTKRREAERKAAESEGRHTGFDEAVVYGVRPLVTSPRVPSVAEPEPA